VGKAARTSTTGSLPGPDGGFAGVSSASQQPEPGDVSAEGHGRAGTGGSATHADLTQAAAASGPKSAAAGLWQRATALGARAVARESSYGRVDSSAPGPASGSGGVGQPE
jgi:hypothetical protein